MIDNYEHIMSRVYVIWVTASQEQSRLDSILQSVIQSVASSHPSFTCHQYMSVLIVEP